jgi:splicing factor U2AF subunit
MSHVSHLSLQYATEEEAAVAIQGLKGRLYAGVKLDPVYCPVTDFKDSRCRQHDDMSCKREGYCNFMHIRALPRWLRRELEACRRRGADRDYGRERDYPRDHPRDRDYGRRSDDRDRDYPPRGGDRDRDFRPARSSSAERRAMIAQWSQPPQ